MAEHLKPYQFQKGMEKIGGRGKAASENRRLCLLSNGRRVGTRHRWGVRTDNAGAILPQSDG
jgi:hypothetical protein